MNDIIQKIADEIECAAQGPTHIGSTMLTAGFMKDWATRLRAISALAAQGGVRVPRYPTKQMEAAGANIASRKRPGGLMGNERIDVLAVLDDRIGMAAPMSADDLRQARAAVAELIERERQQREVLELLCETYIANRHSLEQWGFVKCVTLGGNRLDDTETGRLWLRANNLSHATRDTK